MYFIMIVFFFLYVMVFSVNDVIGKLVIYLGILLGFVRKFWNLIKKSFCVMGVL